MRRSPCLVLGGKLNVRSEKFDPLENKIFHEIPLLIHIAIISGLQLKIYAIR